MSKHYHSANNGRRMLEHGRKEQIGPFANLRHPKRQQLPGNRGTSKNER